MSELKKKKRKMNGNSILYLFIGCSFVVLFTILLLVQLFRPSYTFEAESRVDMVQMTDITGAENAYDTVGWIQVQGTDIDLPVIKNEDEDVEDYPVELDGYTWLTNYKPSFHNNLKIEGHNIFNLSSKPELESEDFDRFEQLMDFVYYDFAQKNQYFQLTLDGKDYVYKIFAVAFIPKIDLYFYPLGDDYSTEEMQKYLDSVLKHNLYKYDVDVNSSDSIASLSTCTRFFGLEDQYQFSVYGRLLRDGEKAQSYRVSKSANYDEIETKLKGDDESAEA